MRAFCRVWSQDLRVALRWWRAYRWAPPEGVYATVCNARYPSGPPGFYVALSVSGGYSDSVHLCPDRPWPLVAATLEWKAGLLLDRRDAKRRAIEADRRERERAAADEEEDARHFDACEDILGGDGYDLH